MWKQIAALAFISAVLAVGGGYFVFTVVRDVRSAVTESRRLRARRLAGLPDTDHPVEMLELYDATSSDPPLLYAICSVDDCGWDEWAPADVGYGEQERVLREKAARHSTVVATKIVNPLD